MCFMFQTRPFWRCMRVPTSKLENRFEFFFGERNLEINDYENAKNLLMNKIIVAPHFAIKTTEITLVRQNHIDTYQSLNQYP